MTIRQGSWLLVLCVLLAAGCASTTGRSASAQPASASPSASTSPWPVAPIGHAGRWLTDAAGRVLLLHGVNMVEKEPPYDPAAFGFGAADAAWLESEGFDVVRLGMLATGALPAPGVVDRAYLAGLERTSELLAAHHVLVLLDAHQDGYGPSVGSDGFPAWMTLTGGAHNTHVGFPAYYVANPAVEAAFQHFWQDATTTGGERLQQADAAMFRAAAELFGTPHSPVSSDLLGYEAMNEPWPGVEWLPCVTAPKGCPAEDRALLDPFDARIDRAIRSVDPTHLVFVEPWVLFNFGNVATSIGLPAGDPRSGLSFHVYPVGPSSEEVLAELAHARAWSRRTGGALLVTEWGATTDPTTASRIESLLDRALLPWIFWSFDADVVRSLADPPTGANLDAPLVAVLAEPHPLAVAGTPKSLSFDWATRTMRFVYSTTPPPGDRLLPGAITSVQVPRSAEPTGYRVEVTGAVVRSRPCAPMLELAAKPGAASVRVVVAPELASRSGCS
jgi:endoglycosylceramidase